MSLRVYVPTTPEDLRAHWSEGGVGLLRAHAVTDALRADWPDGGEEEWEYVALLAAADESALDQAGEEQIEVRRVVIAADADGCTPDPDRGLTAVTLDTAVSVRAWASVHADLAPVPVDSEDDLAWFAPEEIPGLLEG